MREAGTISVTPSIGSAFSADVHASTSCTDVHSSSNARSP
ncbi:Uncharacterised protein [Mycobacteroides abscessus subsp. abscessus]|nr:Uncharacterised protein [Mycobacteroides abscessus subsp. abscessus]